MNIIKFKSKTPLIKRKNGSMQNIIPDAGVMPTSRLTILATLALCGRLTVAGTMRKLSELTGHVLTANNAAGIMNRMVKSGVIKRTGMKGTTPGTGRKYEITKAGISDLKSSLEFHKACVSLLTLSLNENCTENKQLKIVEGGKKKAHSSQL